MVCRYTFLVINYLHDDTKWTLDTIVRSTIRAMLHRVGPYRDIGNKYQHINIITYADTYCRCHDMVLLRVGFADHSILPLGPYQEFT